MKPVISIVILTWNRAAFLKICLEKMFAALSGEVPCEIIIMDNASTDNTSDILVGYIGREDTRIVRNSQNLRLNAYKKLFPLAKGKFILEVDDDILEFPQNFDKIFVEYFDAFPDYGYLALNVIQNEKTNGAKGDSSCYKDDVRGDKIVEEGPAGGWCTAFRRSHYRLFRPLLAFFHFSMARPEDGTLMGFIQKILRKRTGLIKNALCLHATGPAYAKEFGLIKREYEKYKMGGREDIAEAYLPKDSACESGLSTQGGA